MGISSVTSHEKGKKHRDHCDMKSQSVDLLHHFVCPTSVEATPTVEDVHTAAITATSSSAAESTLSKAEVATTGATSSGTGTSGQQSVGAMRHFFVKDEVTRAEIIWALHGVMSHSSDRANSSATDLFHVMFPDSNIATQFKMKKDKNSYVVTYGLCSFFQEQLISDVRKSACFAVSFDESLNTVAQRGQMDIVIRFWNAATNEVSTRYLTSAFLGHATAGDLLGHSLLL